MMNPGVRRFMLTAHITFSVGWLGAIVGFLALVIAALNSYDVATVRAVWVALELMGWLAIVPLALGSLLTGFIVSLATSWGLLSHYWVLFKLLLTTLAIIILLLNMQAVSAIADAVAQTGRANLGGLQSELLHATGGLLVLLLTTILSVYKPRGMTQYGRRLQREQRHRSMETKVGLSE